MRHFPLVIFATLFSIPLSPVSAAKAKPCTDALVLMGGISGHIHTPIQPAATKKQQLQARLSGHQEALRSEQGQLRELLREEKIIAEEITEIREQLNELRMGAGDWSIHHSKYWIQRDIEELEIELESVRNEWNENQELIEIQNDRILRRRNLIEAIEERLVPPDQVVLGTVTVRRVDYNQPR